MNLDLNYEWWVSGPKIKFQPYPNREEAIQAAIVLASHYRKQIPVYCKATLAHAQPRLVGYANPRGVSEQPRSEPAKPLTPYDRAVSYMGVIEPFNPIELKSAFRVLAKEKHPDTGGSQEAFLELQTNYDLIIKTKRW